jgi:PhnB protein
MLFLLLGAPPPAVLHEWFHTPAQDGQVIDDPQTRPWGATDSQVTDRHGLRWLIGYEADDPQ